MAVMERTHGWHQRDGGFSCPKAIERAVQGGDRAGDDDGASRLQRASRHGGSIGWVSRQQVLLTGGMPILSRPVLSRQPKPMLRLGGVGAILFAAYGSGSRSSVARAIHD